jgi:hypothetical protein
LSWQLAAYGLLALVLVGGFAWYELSRPPSRIVALVAALAALAVAGRLAFAPIPNVVATTDIVLIAGYSVGAAPGFAVGALSAVVSNLWLGQGPWTPWQMAGWGLVGLGGAALAPLVRRRLGRGGLALACGVAGLAYGALLDLSVMVGYGGEQSLDRYLAISARGVPFNIAHAAGNVALALAAGPALVRMISRYRSRFEFEWRDPARSHGGAIGAIPFSVLLASVLLVLPVAAHGRGGSSGSGWLQRVQNSDGGFPASPGDGSSEAMTGWASLGLEAAGVNPLDVNRRGPSPIAFLRTQAHTLRSTGDLERTILALEGAGIDAHHLGGVDLVDKLRKRRSQSGSFEGQVNLTAFGILALRAAGAPPPRLQRSAAWLHGAENRDGGWGFQPRAASDADSTGAALQGLAAANRGSAIGRGAAYLRHVQRRDGGFALAGADASNTQSTAWAVQGLVAAGVDPARVRTRGNSPLDYLHKRQAGDGHYRYSSASDQTPVWVTAQALVAVHRKAFPLASVPRAGQGDKRTATRAGSIGTGTGSASPGGGRPGRRAAGAKRGGSASGANAGGGRGSGAAKPTGRGGSREVSGQPVSAPVPSQGASGKDGLATPAYVGVGFALLTAALTAGFLWYRRRLP